MKKAKYFRWWDQYFFKIVPKKDKYEAKVTRLFWFGYWITLEKYGDHLKKQIYSVENSDLFGNDRWHFPTTHDSVEAARKDLAVLYKILVILDKDRSHGKRSVKGSKGSISTIWFEESL